MTERLLTKMQLAAGAGVLALGLLTMPTVANAQGLATQQEQAAFEKKAEARKKLADALARIASDGRNGFAMLNAGEAAVALDDPQAALGFLARAQAILPQEPKIRSALGAAMVQLGRHADALRYFGEAEAMGVRNEAYLPERALARDLAGDNPGALRDYRSALSQDPGNSDLIREYAISQGVSGDVAAAMQTLGPLLARQDRSAWRARAFILAMNGNEKEAGETVDAVMPANFADQIKPYFARMGQLTASQKAAAAHLGKFPSGMLDASPVRLASAGSAIPPQQPPAAARPTRAQRQAQRKADRDKARAAQVAAAKRPTRVAAARPQPAPTPAPKSAIVAPQPAPQTTASSPVTVIEKAPQPQTPLSQAIPVVVPTPVPAADTPTANVPAATQNTPGPRPGFSADVVPGTPSATLPDGNATRYGPVMRVDVPAQPKPQPSLADIVAAIEIADTPPPASAALSAESLERIRREQLAAQEAEEKLAAAQRVRDKAQAAAKAKADAEQAAKKASPARHWVQIATGADAKALAFDFRRLSKKYSGEFKGLDGWTSQWGQTRRLVVGPFDSVKEAKAWEAAYRKAGGDAFAWSSTDGLEVEKIASK